MIIKIGKNKNPNGLSETTTTVLDKLNNRWNIVEGFVNLKIRYVLCKINNTEERIYEHMTNDLWDQLQDTL
jgi:hypothetical protein